MGLRCRAFGEFVVRLHGIDGRAATSGGGAADPAAALVALGRIGAVVGRSTGASGTEVRYLPSGAARSAVAEDQDGAWPPAVAAKQRKAFRRSVGAVFRFPLAHDGGAASRADGPGAAPGDAVEVFITDWSPVPAACAVAVHPAHPLGVAVPAGQAAVFAGRYCRHPLTGDLLPVWSAGWVKPEFGTGAVLVNPAHDPTDLAFACQVGLPVRFALAASPDSGDPASWPVPPVVKTGVAVRTGATDGLAFDAAAAAYFDIIEGRHLAVRHEDRGVGSFPVAVSADGPAAGAVEIEWDHGRGTVGTSGGSVLPVVPSAVLAAVEASARSADLTVVVPSPAVDTDLLAVRLLLAEPVLGSPAGGHRDVVAVGGVVGSTDGIDPGTLSLALLACTGAAETLALKPQTVEPCERFLRTHAQLVAQPLPDGDGPIGPHAGVASTIKAMLVRHELKQAFTALARLQKSLVNEAGATGTAVTAYEVLAQVLAGVPTRHDATVLGKAWRDL